MFCFVFFKVPRCEAFYGGERVVVFFYDDFIVTYPYAEFSASITEANMQCVCLCVCAVFFCLPPNTVIVSLQAKFRLWLLDSDQKETKPKLI